MNHYANDAYVKVTSSALIRLDPFRRTERGTRTQNFEIFMQNRERTKGKIQYDVLFVMQTIEVIIQYITTQ